MSENGLVDPETETTDLKIQALDGPRTEERSAGDERLFAWLSTVAAGGWRWQLHLADAIEEARAAFPKRGHPAQTSLCLCHLTRKRIIHRAQKAALRKERPAHWIALDGDAPPGSAHALLARHAAHSVHGAEQARNPQ